MSELRRASTNGGSVAVKEEVLQGWLIAGRRRWSTRWRSAPSPRKRRTVPSDSRRHGCDRRVAQARRPAQRLGRALEAYAINGDLASLRRSPRAGRRGVRLDAIRKIGIVDGDAANGALRDIYARNRCRDPRAALQGMLISGDDRRCWRCIAAREVQRREAHLDAISVDDGSRRRVADHRPGAGGEVKHDLIAARRHPLVRRHRARAGRAAEPSLPRDGWAS